MGGSRSWCRVGLISAARGGFPFVGAADFPGTAVLQGCFSDAVLCLPCALSGISRLSARFLAVLVSVTLSCASPARLSAAHISTSHISTNHLSTSQISSSHLSASFGGSWLCCSSTCRLWVKDCWWRPWSCDELVLKACQIVVEPGHVRVDQTTRFCSKLDLLLRIANRLSQQRCQTVVVLPLVATQKLCDPAGCLVLSLVRAPVQGSQLCQSPTQLGRESLERVEIVLEVHQRHQFEREARI